MKTSKIFSTLLACVLTVGLCMTTAFADNWQNAHTHGNPEGATVSGEVDTATNQDPSMGTNFTMFIESDPVVNDVPNMGDMGLDPNMLLIATFGSGIAYLLVSRYAYSKG